MESTDLPLSWFSGIEAKTGDTIFHKIARSRRKVDSDAYIIQMILSKVKAALAEEIVVGQGAGDGAGDEKVSELIANKY